MAASASYSLLNGHSGMPGAFRSFIGGRRGRTIVGATVLVFLMMVGLYSTPPETIKEYGSFGRIHFPSWSSKESPYGLSPLLTPSEISDELENGTLSTIPSTLMKGNPSFHLLMNARVDNVEFCKSTTSAMLLNYPPPTLTNWNCSQNSEEIAKIEGVVDYLKDGKKIGDDDLVLIVDSPRVIFQLPAKVMVTQYQLMLRSANTRLKQLYGVVEQEDSNQPKRQRFMQTVLFGASKVCLEGDERLVSCKNVPESPLPQTVYGPQTDRDPSGATNRPRFLDASMVIGPAKDLLAVYSAALVRIGLHAEDNSGRKVTAQAVLASLYGEQELGRQAVMEGRSNVKSWFGSDYQGTNNEGAVESGHEFAIGLDYTAALFQPLSHLYDYPAEAGFYVPAATGDSMSFPPALANAAPPYTRFPTAKDLDEGRLTPWDAALNEGEDLDALPSIEKDYTQLALFTNTKLHSTPAALIFPEISKDDDKPSRKEVYERMWWQPHARALLRRYLRSSSDGLAAHRAAVGGDAFWDMRGGQGGVWALNGVILEMFSDICKTTEPVVFNDSKGEFLKERPKEDESKKKAANKPAAPKPKAEKKGQ